MLEQKVSNYSVSEDQPSPFVSKGFMAVTDSSNVLPGDTERKLITACFSSADNTDLLDALKYHLESGGSRARASICLNAGIALGLDSKDAEVLSVCAELLHNASLIQDDLQDNDKKRRGKPAVWQRFGNNVALGLVDLMIASSFKQLIDLTHTEKLPQLICKLHDAISVTLQGQSLDTSTLQLPQNLDHCLMVAEKKSGPLFALALELPLLAAGQQKHANQAFRAACAFGTGYQIYDDILDFDFDRRNSHSNNVVCALNETNNLRQSIKESIKLSRQYLQTAERLAKSLPSECGKPLANMATQLQLKLNEFVL